MTDVLQQDGPAQRLTGEGVGWLTTAGADGQPSRTGVVHLGRSIAVAA